MVQNKIREGLEFLDEKEIKDELMIAEMLLNYHDARIINTDRYLLVKEINYLNQVLAEKRKLSEKVL